MKNFNELFKIVIDKVFNWNVFFLAFMAGLVFTVVSVADAKHAKDERLRQIVESCYNQGLILVDTDAGKYCVDPKSLVKVK